MALHKHSNTELYVVVIDMILSVKTDTGEMKSLCKHVENDYSNLNCHPNEQLFFSQRITCNSISLYESDKLFSIKCYHYENTPIEIY